MMFGKFIDSSTVTGTQIRLDNEQWLRGRNFANTGDLNILRINSSNQIEFKQIPYVEGQGRLALYSELDGILTSVEYLYGQLTEVTGDITTIQGDIVDIQAEIDALQEEVGDFALKDLSNLTATAIPSGINLESVSIDQSAFTSFALRTKNQTTSVSGRILIRTGTSDSAFSSGGINIDSGAVTNAIGAAASTVMTGAVALVSGTISSGTRGSTGTAFLRSGGIANISSATTYSGNSGIVGVVSGTIQSSFNGGTVTGNSGFASLQTGPIIATVSGATTNGTSGSISVNTGGINTFVAGAIVNGNSGPLSFTSGGVTGFGTSNSNTGTVSVFSGNITNANNTGNTGSVSIFSGSNSGTGGSGSLSISTGQSSISGNTGNISISTGVAVSGSQGNIRLTAPFVELKQFTRLTLEDNSADQLVRLQLKNATSEGYGEFFFNRIRSDKSVFIGAMESHVDDNGAPVFFSGTFLLSDTDGQYKTSDVYLQTLSNAGFRDATNLAVSTGDIYIKTESSFVQGTETDANTGNISLQTGTPDGAGTKGYISLNAAYITANSTQLKDLADGTDPQDAVTVSQLGGISGSFALTNLSNLGTPTLIPDGVGLNSVSTTSFSVSTSDSVTTDPTGAIDINTGDINNVASSANTGIMGIRSGETNGTGNTGEVQIYSGNNNGTGSSGNIVISAGTTADDDKTTGSVEIRSGFPFGNSNSGSINIYSHNAQKRSGDVSLHSGNSTAVGDSGNILIYSGNVTSGIRGSIDLNGQSTSIYLRNFDVTGNHSLFRIANSSPGSIGEIQFLTYAMGNNTMGMRIFESDPISGFSINGWGRLNQNGGPFDFMSTKAYPNVDSTLTGGDFNIVSASTDYIDPALGINASVNSGNVNINTANGYITGSNTDANSGNINLVTGQPQGTGSRGNVNLNGWHVIADVDLHVKIKTPGSASEVWLGNHSYGQLGGPFLYALGVASNRRFEIGSEGIINQNPGLTELHGAAITSSIDGSYVSGEIDIYTKIQTGINATNASYSSGDINIYSDDADVYGTGYPDANTGNVNISTGTPQGSGTRGFISLDGDYISANSTQIKNLADGTDPQDAVTVSQLGGISGSYALTDLSNLVSPTAIPDGVGLTSLTVPTIPNPLAAFEIKTSDQVGANGSGGVKLYSGNIFSPASGQNTGIASLSSGLTLGSGNTGDVNISSGDNVGSGNSGSVNISTGASVVGTRGSINLTAREVNSYIPNTGRYQILNSAGSGRIEFDFADYGLPNDSIGMRIWNSSPINGFHIIGIGQNNQNGGAFLFESAYVLANADGVYSGGDFNIKAVSSGAYFGTATNMSVNSGNVNITTENGYITGSSPNANSGNINLTTGNAQGTGTRGSIGLDGEQIISRVNWGGGFKVTTTGALSEVMIHNRGFGIQNSPEILFNGIPQTSVAVIQAFSANNNNGATFYLASTIINASADGTYTGGDLNISASGQGPSVPTNYSINSGTLRLSTANGAVGGSFSDANSGNVEISTGTSQGSGTRGFISLDGDYVTVSSTQIKDVADPTDPQDALTLNYFNNNIPNVAALDFYPLQAYNTYAPIYADATAGVLDPVTPTNPRPGWYFKNSAGSPQKINWYFFDGNIVSCELQNFAAFAVVTLDSIASLPYFIFYTFPTGSGDAIPSFAHSIVVYSAPYVPSAVVGTKYLVYFGAEPDVFPYLPRIELTYNAAASAGDQGATELVSTAAFSTESSATANQVQVMVENLGLNLSNFKAYFDLLIFPVFEESQNYYGSFYSTQDQDNLVPDIARAMTFNNTDEANGVSIVSTSQITFATGGLYNVQFSAQFTHSNSSSQDVDIWLSKNGVNVPYTNSRETLAGQVSVISAWNFFVRVNAGDYVEIYWSSPSNDVVIEYTGPQTVPTRPETPSIILTVNKIIS